MAKSKDFTVSVAPDTVMYTNISKSKDGYNSARMVAKISDKEYMSISYEWEGSGVPAFAMDLMGFMKSQAAEEDIWEGQEEAYEEFAAKKGVNPFMKKKDEDEEEDPKKKKKDDKKKKAKK
ncbi:hypothetical protein DRQ25_01580 [Candidatus Fermentibacteria bacterium]|nr:MAG: hypothetical protein DRQ25_01580 [Candidatus Fermentibacteria bacterium]